MEYISEIISQFYQKYLPITQKLHLSLELDFPDTTLTTGSPAQLSRTLDRAMRTMITQSHPGDQIRLAISPRTITLTNNNTILPPSACQNLASTNIRIKSRVGFGTNFILDIF
ncbi:hypothetical protein IJG90_02120 [Candidatus Saccharibacteria bacterium]|nr:hypothetical protein [Candidatus Saccharibacteria bacterium]